MPVSKSPFSALPLDSGRHDRLRCRASRDSHVTRSCRRFRSQRFRLLVGGEAWCMSARRMTQKRVVVTAKSPTSSPCRRWYCTWSKSERTLDSTLVKRTCLLLTPFVPRWPRSIWLDVGFVPNCRPFSSLPIIDSFEKDTTRRSTVLKASSSWSSLCSAGVVARLSIVGFEATPPLALQYHLELNSNCSALLALFRSSYAMTTTKTSGLYMLGIIRGTQHAVPTCSWLSTGGVDLGLSGLCPGGMEW